MIKTNKIGRFLLLGILAFYLSGSSLIIPGKECCHLKSIKKKHSCCELEKKIELSKCPAQENGNEFKFSKCNCKHVSANKTGEFALTPNYTYKQELSCICIIEQSLLAIQSSNSYTEINSGKSLQEIPIFLVTGTLLI